MERAALAGLLAGCLLAGPAGCTSADVHAETRRHPLRLGMGREEIRDLLGPPRVRAAEDPGFEEWHYRYGRTWPGGKEVLAASGLVVAAVLILPLLVVLAHGHADVGGDLPTPETDPGPPSPSPCHFILVLDGQGFLRRIGRVEVCRCPE